MLESDRNMTVLPSREFDIGALYNALDAERISRGLSWPQVTREINRQFARLPSRPIAISTVSGMLSRRAIEGDSALQMLRWLRRTPESFVRGFSAADGDALPEGADDRIIRFDTRAIYAALDVQRIGRGMTWKEVAAEIGGMNAPALTRLSKGGRTGFPDVMRIVRWLGRPAASFTYLSNW